MLGGKGQAEEKEAGEAGQGAGVAGVRAQIQAGWYPEDLRGGVRSLWGLAGQLLLIEAHDMVHKLVLLAGLDHAAPAQQRHTVGMGMSRDGLWEGAPPQPRGVPIIHEWPCLYSAWSGQPLPATSLCSSLSLPTLAQRAEQRRHDPPFSASGLPATSYFSSLFIQPPAARNQCLFPSVFPTSGQPASPYLACPPAPHPVHVSVSPFCP